MTSPADDILGNLEEKVRSRKAVQRARASSEQKR
eukprot:SAG11_NODE_29760_length_307_cov_1.245192_1_plen_33_part_10